MLPPVDAQMLIQAIELCKADLATSMVYEFTSLEGTMGTLYAKAEGLDPLLAEAILDHRLPRGADDALPQGTLGLVVGILDRVDSLLGYFSIGAAYSGSSDPFGLRRLMLTLIRLVRHGAPQLNLLQLANASLATFGPLAVDAATAQERFFQFLCDRLIAAAQEDGAPYDLAQAARVHAAEPAAYFAALAALQGAEPELLQNLAEEHKRMVKIATDPAEQVDPALALEPSEKGLLELVEKGLGDVRQHVRQRDFAGALQLIRPWVPPIHQFFEAILINVDDLRLRRNRHALVQSVAQALRLVADFTAVVKQKN
jgi:glycyl-tRNA synthetase beta subunit